MDRDFKGVWIPKHVWLDKRLSALDKMVLTKIENDGHVDITQILTFFHCSEAKAVKSILKLKSLEYLN